MENARRWRGKVPVARGRYPDIIIRARQWPIHIDPTTSDDTAEREAARNRAVSLTTCNGTARIYWLVSPFSLQKGTSPRVLTRVFHKTKRAEGCREREETACGGETSKGKANLRRTGRYEKTSGTRRGEHTSCSIYTHERADGNERTRARPMECNFAIRASARIVHAPLKTTKQCVEARFCPVTSRPFSKQTAAATEKPSLARASRAVHARTIRLASSLRSQSAAALALRANP